MRSLLFIALASALTACSPYDPDLGPAPFLCGPSDQNPRCPDGYTCQLDSTNGMEYCLAPSGVVPVDANNLNCADDSNLEPNNDKEHAWQTPVATQSTSFPLSGLAICPAGDKDNYSITITTMGQNLEMLVEYDAMGAVLQGSLLNAGGTPIMNASPMPGTNVLRAYVPNLPPGVFYAQVYGPNMGAVQTNNYKMTLNVTGP